MIKVVLTWDEVEQCGHWAVRRSVENYRLGRQHLYGARGTGLDHHFHGCLGEYAVAKHFGIDPGADELGKIDVGIYEVRATDWWSGRLILHNKDRDNSPHVLARCHDLPNMWLCGWLMGRAGKCRKYWGEPNGQPGRAAYLVPNDELWPMDLLPVSKAYEEYVREEGR